MFEVCRLRQSDKSVKEQNRDKLRKKVEKLKLFRQITHGYPANTERERETDRQTDREGPATKHIKHTEIFSFH